MAWYEPHTTRGLHLVKSWFIHYIMFQYGPHLIVYAACRGGNVVNPHRAAVEPCDEGCGLDMSGAGST